MATKRHYTKDQMDRAIAEVQKGEKMSVAATKYGVPRITLRNKVKGISPIDCNFGPSTVLSLEEEKLLVKWILYMADNHFPVTKDHLLDSVQKLILEKNLDNCPFTNNRPGKKWFSSFMNRHPELSQRTAQNLTKARENVTEEELKQWFQTIETYIEGKGLSDALKDPSRIYNTDESAFYLQPKAGKVIVRRGEKNVYTSAGDEKENLTVLLTANAAGNLAPPMVVYGYERIPTLIVRSVPQGWGLGRSDTGWMCSKTFYEYITNVFNPWLIQKEIIKPVIFFLDGHKSHMSLHLANFCRDNGIELIALFPNSTHLIQPMDVAVFRPLKLSWSAQVMKWKTENPGARLKKEDFAPNLHEALKSICPETIQNGFRKSGLYPFCSEYVDMTKIASSNRTIRSHPLQTEDLTRNTQFLRTLETKINEVFSSEKITVFNQLYFKRRSDIENLLPDEDQSLYVIWAKTKSIVTETPPITIENDMMCQKLSTHTIETQQDLTTTVVSNKISQIIDDSNAASSMAASSKSPDILSSLPTAHQTPKSTTTSSKTPTISSSLPGANQTPESTVTSSRTPDISTPPPRAHQTSKSAPKYALLGDVPSSSPSSYKRALSFEPSHVPDIGSDSLKSSVLKPFPVTSSQPFPVSTPPETKQIFESALKINPIIDFSLPFPHKEASTCSKLIVLPYTSKTKSGQPISTLPKSFPPTTDSSNAIAATIMSDLGTRLKAATSKLTNTVTAVTATITSNITTPLQTTTSKLSTYTPIGNVPSPFKRALFWPEPEIKKRRIKDRLPSAITSDPYIEYVEKKENEKKRQLEEKEKRAKERKEKQILRQKLMQEKKINKKSKKGKAKTKRIKKKQISSSSSEEIDTEVEYQDSEYNLEDDLFGSEEDTIPLNTLVTRVEKSKYVIIMYEGEYFPGIIKTAESKQYKVSTMVLSKNNTFRWPETPDEIWYDEKDIVEFIREPLQINKRGFFKVEEMNKYLPFVL